MTTEAEQMSRQTDAKEAQEKKLAKKDSDESEDGQVSDKATSKKEPAKTAQKPTKTEYYDMKRRILRFEKDNYTMLAILVDTNGYAKMFDHSAVIYASQIVKKLGFSAQLVSDTDYEETTNKPVCIFGKLEALEKNLKRIGLKKYAHQGVGICYKLGYKVEPADYLAMLKENQTLKERANKLVLPTEIYPAYRYELAALVKTLSDKSRKMQATGQTVVGVPLFKTVADMYEEFICSANGHGDIDKCLSNAVVGLRRIDALIAVAMEARLIDEETTLKMLQQVAKVQKKLAGAIQKREIDRGRGYNNADRQVGATAD